ncbi:MAG: adenylyl-sulfate kinase [Phycisphaeraceae bacterium]
MTICGDRANAGAEGWAVWLTGLPASGKSTIARQVVKILEQREAAGMMGGVEVLESDALRECLTPGAGYGEAERDLFYAAVAWMGVLLTRHGVNVVYDATAHRLRYREAARQAIPRFVEVWVRCPVRVCRQRDRKGIYAAAERGEAEQVPGVGVEYEANERAEVIVDAERESAEAAAGRIVQALEKRGWLDGVLGIKG